MSTSLVIKAKASKKLLTHALTIALDIESKLSAYKFDSDIVIINKNAGLKEVAVSDLTLEALKISIEIAEATNGLYDPSIGALSHFGYQFGWRDERLLDTKQKKHFSSLVNYKNITINEKSVKLEKKGMALDLGGMGKGFAVGKIADYLKQEGVKHAIISLGGEVYSFGKQYKIAIAHPRLKSVAGVVHSLVDSIAVTTSGDYERFIEDYEHHHILSAKKGESENVFASLTLVSPHLDPARMDALNTALFQLPIDEQQEILKAYQLDAIAFDKDMTLECYGQESDCFEFKRN
jgi:FAD:protein FMN transferase